MKTILYQPLFINPQAYFVFPQLYHIEKGDSYIEPANITGQLIINNLSEGLTLTPTVNVIQDSNQVDFSLFKDKHIRISQYTNIGAVVLGEWYIPGTPEPEQPDWFKESIVAWYSPCKQKLTNYDVIEAYVEDFTNWNYVKARGVATISQHKFIITECILKGLSIVEDIQEPYSNLTVRIIGITDNQEVLITDYVNGQHQIINTITEDGIYTIEDRHHFVGFGCNFVGTCNITIEQLPTSILKDLSGNGLDAYMYGFTGKLNSGVGIYKEDFSTYTKNNQAILSDISPNKFIINEVLGANGFLYTGKMTSNPITIQVDGEFNGVSFRYLYGNSGNKFVVITEPGTYELPASDGSTSNNGFFGTEQVGKCNIVVTQIPDYPNSLCYAGKQYCQAYNIPKFTDYTIITRRAILSLNGSFGLISKRISPKQLGAFIFEKDNNVAGAERNTLRAFSFMSSTAVNPNLDYSITYQTKNKYNGQDLTVGSTGDSDVFLIGAGLYNEANGVGEFITAVHDDIIILKRSLTINEINDITEAIFNETIIEEQTNNTPKP